MRKNRAMFLAALGVSLLLPVANAGPISVGPWYEFSFTAAAVPTTGCFPDHPGGQACAQSSSIPSTFLDAPPWTLASAIRSRPSGAW